MKRKGRKRVLRVICLVWWIKLHLNHVTSQAFLCGLACWDCPLGKSSDVPCDSRQSASRGSAHDINVFTVGSKDSKDIFFVAYAMFPSYTRLTWAAWLQSVMRHSQGLTQDHVNCSLATDLSQTSTNLSLTSGATWIKMSHSTQISLYTRTDFLSKSSQGVFCI